jgi:hypothetical protein
VLKNQADFSTVFETFHVLEGLVCILKMCYWERSEKREEGSEIGGGGEGEMGAERKGERKEKIEEEKKGEEKGERG